MRKLAIICGALAVAVFLSFYVLPAGSVIPLAVISGLLAIVFFFLQKRSDRAARCFFTLLGVTIGFAVWQLHWNATLRYAVLWDESVQTMDVMLLEAPTEGEHYLRLHVQRMEAPKLEIMLYDYRGELPPLRPGELISVTARFRRADLRYGEANYNTISKNIYLTGTLRDLEPAGTNRVTVRSFAARCSKTASDFASQLFSADTAVFLRALMLGDKTDFYRDIPLYAAMRGAGFMHIVAVSGVFDLLLGFYIIARKPVTARFSGTRLRKCTPKLRFT